VNLEFRFRADVDGTVTVSALQERGQYRIARRKFVGPTLAPGGLGSIRRRIEYGWQQVTFSSPVRLQPELSTGLVL